MPLFYGALSDDFVIQIFKDSAKAERNVIMTLSVTTELFLRRNDGMYEKRAMETQTFFAVLSVHHKTKFRSVVSGKSRRPFSFQGLPKTIEVDNIGNNYSLHVTWLERNVQKYNASFINRPEICSLITSPHGSFSYCLNFTSNVYTFFNFIQGYFFFRAKFKRLHNIFMFSLKSWDDASNHCTSVGGYLPIFRSPHEMDDFITLIKLSPSLPPITAIFMA